MFSAERDNILKNGQISSSKNFDAAIFDGCSLVYEVIRVISGKAIFLDEHIGRLLNSLRQSAHKTFENVSSIKDHINTLILSNPGGDGNIFYCLAIIDDEVQSYTYFIKHHYPTQDDYSMGVELRSLRAMRSSPNAKVWNTSLREQAENIRSSNGVYEVLLIDDKGFITEGSRSNIFLIRDDYVLTPPESKVLQGITRQKVIELCLEKGIKVLKKDILYSDIGSYSAAFITGTSPKLLPVRKIDGILFDPSNTLMRIMMKAYDALLI